jgi:hypothetical protein
MWASVDAWLVATSDKQCTGMTDLGKVSSDGNIAIRIATFDPSGTTSPRFLDSLAPFALLALLSFLFLFFSSFFYTPLLCECIHLLQASQF